MSFSLGHGESVPKGDRLVCSDCGQTTGWLRLAFNYNRLKRENYYNTPDGRAVIEMLYRRYPNDSTVRNWLMREAKRGRLRVSPQWQSDIDMLREAESSGDPHMVEAANARLDHHDRPDIVLWRTGTQDENGMPEPVQPGMVLGLQKMLSQGMNGKNIDLMNMTYDEVMPIYQEWHENHRRDPNAGQVVHAFPNGWTMRRLEDADSAFNEGEEMQNCVPKFAPSIESGDTHIFSLRDESNKPHANVLITPREEKGHWEGGTVRDVRGKQNMPPKDEYAALLHDWFQTFNERPGFSPNPGPPNDPGPGPAERYGLEARYAHLQQENWVFESSWEFTSSVWNRVRNQLIDANKFGIGNDMRWRYLKAQYGHRQNPETGEWEEHDKHGKIADWLMKQVVRNNVKMPSQIRVKADAAQELNDRIVIRQAKKQEMEQKIAETQERLADKNLWYDPGNPMPDPTELAKEREALTRDLMAFNQERDDHQAYIDQQQTELDELKKQVSDPSNRLPLTVTLPETTWGGNRKTVSVDDNWLNQLKKLMQQRREYVKNIDQYEENLKRLNEELQQTGDPDKRRKIQRKIDASQEKLEQAQQANLDQLSMDDVAMPVTQAKWMEDLTKNGGKSVYKFDDGHELRWINSEDAAQLEGDIMGHCIAGSKAEAATGNHVSLSLRDKRGLPHATFQLNPTNDPIIDWDGLHREADNPAEFVKKFPTLRSMSQGPQPGGEFKPLDDFVDERGIQAHFRNLGQPLQRNDEPVLTDNGDALNVGDYVLVRGSASEPIDEDDWVYGYVADHPDVDGDISVHRLDGVEGGAPGGGWWVSPNFVDRAAPPVIDKKEEEVSPDEFHEAVDAAKARQEEHGGRTGLPENVRKELIKHGYWMPDFRGSSARQIQGKSNNVPNEKYLPYIRQWLDTFPDEDRPRSAFGSMFQVKPLQYIDHFPDLHKGLDELGFKVDQPRDIDWNAIVHSANDEKPKLEGNESSKFYVPINSQDAEYDPKRGEQLLQEAINQGQARNLFEALNKWENQEQDGDAGEWQYYRENPASHYNYPQQMAEYGFDEDDELTTLRALTQVRPRDEKIVAPGALENNALEQVPYAGETIPHAYINEAGARRVWGRCPHCQDNTWLHDDRDGDLRHIQCPVDDSYFKFFDAEGFLDQPKNVQNTNQIYSPYQAAMVQDLGPRMEEYFRTQDPASYTWALHGAPEQTQFKCPNCGSADINWCNQCDGENHMICQACNHWIEMPPTPTAARQGALSAANTCPYNDGLHKVKHENQYGEPCYCLYHPAAKLDSRQAAVQKQSDKLNDFLRNPQNRPDLQTPEGQYFLNYLESAGYADQDTDAMLPWVVREWKKGRLVGPAQYFYEPEDERLQTAVGGWLKDYDPEWVEANKRNFATNSRANMAKYLLESDPKRYNALVNMPKPTNDGWEHLHIPTNDEEQPDRFSPNVFRHWNDWYGSNHPTRREVQDVMSMHAPQLNEVIQKWNEDMANRAGGVAYERGRAIHKDADGWTVQHLSNKRQLDEEGEVMGHCIAGYWPRVRDKGKLVYSLRDENNKPHATWAIDPTHAYCPTCREPHKLRSKDHAERGLWPRKGVRKWDQDVLRPHYLNCKNCEGTMNLVPHLGVIEQLQGPENEAPSKEAQQHIKNYMSTINPEQQPQWASDLGDVYAGDFVAEDMSGGYYSEYHPGDYGLPTPYQNNLDRAQLWKRIVDDEILPSVQVANTNQYEHEDMRDMAKNMVNNSMSMFGDAQWMVPYISEYENSQKQRLEIDWEEFEKAVNSYNEHIKNPNPVTDEHLKEARAQVMAQLRRQFPSDFFKQWAKDHADALTSMVEQRANEMANSERARQLHWVEEEAQHFGFDTYEDAQDMGGYQRLSELGYYNMLVKRGKPWAWGRSGPKNFADYLRAAISLAAKRRSSSRHKTPHRNFTTGRPCHCGFTGHLKAPERSAKLITCQTCGDPLDNGFCPRCDWGGETQSEWADKNPPSVKRDIADGFQAKVYDWSLDPSS